MTLRDYEEWPYDSQVFEEINTDLSLNKGKYYGTISCSNDYLKRVIWYDNLLKDQLKRKSILVKIYEIWQFIDSIPKLKEDILYIPYFECDKRVFNGDRREIRKEDQLYLDETLEKFSSRENIEKLWKCRSSLFFLFSHKMFRLAHKTRFFKWMMKNNEKHHYKLYGISPTVIPTNPMSFINDK
jgi:hypothetical protein